jgi:glycosyltransferase involved in cell wall biosynthesis
MENKVDISVILPIASSFGKDFDILFEKAIDSIKKQQIGINELIIVHSDEESLCNKLNSFDFGDLNVVKVLNSSEHTDYASQVNIGIQNAKSKWISFFEHDDEYSFIWFKNVNDYIQYHPECDGFLPIVVDVDETDVFAGYTNEATFAASFNTEIGILTNDLLNQYQNFQSSGMVVKKSVVDSFGGFKKSIKLTFVYEFLLRLTYNSARIMTIPRLGYKHVNMRQSSIFWSYKNGKNTLTDNEVKFWIDTAKKEYFFTSDRDIKYEETNS